MRVDYTVFVNWWCNVCTNLLWVCPNYGVSRTFVAPSLYIWPVQITQSYRNDCPANTVPYPKRPIIGNSLQIQLTHMLASAVELLASGSELHCTGSHICQLDLLAIADYIIFSIWFATFVPICCVLCPICCELKFPYVWPNMFCPNPPGPTGGSFWSPGDCSFGARTFEVLTYLTNKSFDLIARS